MKVGWISDDPAYLGGAELTQREFRDARPDDVEIIDCPPGGVVAGLDRYVAHNVTQYAADDLGEVEQITWYHHDLSPWIHPDVRRLLDEQSVHIFCSPIQRERYGRDGLCVPPYLNADAYRPSRQVRRNREGICSIAAWRNPGKGGQALSEWAQANGPVDVYGPGPLAPQGPGLDYKGEIAPELVAQTLLRYETFVFLPTDLEPFCRCVAEAWAAGCKLVVNRNIGAAHWISEKPEAMATAREDFWRVVCA